MYVDNQFRFIIIVYSVARMEIGCGEEKGCFGYPSGCIQKQKCAMLSTYKYIHVLVDNVNRSTGYNATIDQMHIHPEAWVAFFVQWVADR